MKKKSYVVFGFLFLLVVNWLSASTSVSGNVNGVWTSLGSPYLVEGDIMVPGNDSLIINPGVVVEFQGHFKFTIEGTIIAEGTPEDSIKFTIVAGQELMGWRHILFDYNENGSTSKFKYCVVEYGNVVNDYPKDGGAFFINFSDNIIISHCDIRHNIALHGGGIYCEYSDIVIENCNIYDNMAMTNGSSGGGISCIYCSPTITNCMVTDNSAENSGAGIYLLSSHSIVSNCLIANNALTSSESGNEYSGGGGISCWSSDATIVACTIVNNSGLNGGGIYMGNASPNIVNSIIWNNYAVDCGYNVYIWNSACAPNFSYCDVAGGVEEFGGAAFAGTYEDNINFDPQFANEVSSDFRLTSTSPCINVGVPDTTNLHIPNVDLDGNPRIYGNRIDIGAYEYNGTEINSNIVTNFLLKQNYPNPFNPNTKISYILNDKSNVKILIYNSLGEIVKVYDKGLQEKGQYEIEINASDLATGSYFYTLQTDKGQITRKMLLIK